MLRFYGWFAARFLTVVTFLLFIHIYVSIIPYTLTPLILLIGTILGIAIIIGLRQVFVPGHRASQGCHRVRRPPMARCHTNFVAAVDTVSIGVFRVDRVHLRVPRYVSSAARRVEGHLAFLNLHFNGPLYNTIDVCLLLNESGVFLLDHLALMRKLNWDTRWLGGVRNINLFLVDLLPD